MKRLRENSSATDQPDVLGQKFSVIKGKENIDVKSNLTRNWSWHGHGTKFSCNIDKLSKPTYAQEANPQTECGSKPEVTGSVAQWFGPPDSWIQSRGYREGGGSRLTAVNAS